MKGVSFLRYCRRRSRWNSGFSLLENLIIIVIVAILVAIALPSWNSFYQARQLNVAQEQIQAGIKQAQHLAKVKRIPYQFLIHQNSGSVQWGSAPVQYDDVGKMRFDAAFRSKMAIDWKLAGPLVHLDDRQTTFRKNAATREWFLVLDDDGTLDGALGRVTLCTKLPNSNQCSQQQRCVIMSTLLGETRRGEWKAKKNDQFNCY